MSDVVFAVACDAGDVKALDEIVAFLSVAIHHIIYSTLVVLLEHGEMEHVLAHEDLLRHLDHLVFAVLVEDDDVVDVRAVAHKLVFLQSSADEAFLTVDVELLVGLDDCGGLDGVEVAYLGKARMVLAVLVLKELEPVGCHLHHVGKVAVDVFYLCLDACHELVGTVFVELQDALHLYLEQAEDVVFGHLANKLRIVWRESLVDMGADGIDVGRLLKFAVLVDALLDEYLLERGEMELFEELAAAYLEFAAEEGLGVLGTVAQHVAHGEELRLVVGDDAAVGRDVDLAVGEGVEGVKGLVGRDAGSEMHLYLHLGGGVVVHLARLDLAFLYGLEDGLDERGGGLAVWYLADDEGLVVELLYLRPHLEHSAALAVVIAADVDAASRGEVGIELEGLAVEIGYGGVAELAEVVGKDLRRQTYGNAFASLCEQQRELDGERDGLFVAAVVGELPFGGLGIEHGVDGKLRQARLYISRGGRPVASEDVAPVALCIDKKVFLSELHKGVADGGVAMRVKLHGVSHNVCHLIISSVVHAFHGMEDAPLHRL